MLARLSVNTISQPLTIVESDAGDEVAGHGEDEDEDEEDEDE